MSKDTCHPSHRAQYCLCGERRGEMVRCAAGISGCNGYFHPTCCGLESDIVSSFGVRSVGLSATSSGAVGDSLYYCSMCVAAYIVAPPPLLPSPLLPKAPVPKVAETPSMSVDVETTGEPENGLSSGDDLENSKEHNTGAADDGNFLREDENQVEDEEEEDDSGGDPDSGWGGLLTSLARNILVHGANGETMSPRELWPPPEEWRELPEQSLNHCGVESDSTRNGAPLRHTLLRGSSDGGSEGNEEDGGKTHAPAHLDPLETRSRTTRSTRAFVGSGTSATSTAGSDGTSDAMHHRDYELPPAVRWEVLQRRYSEMASATGAAETASDSRTSGNSNSRGVGGTGSQRSASMVNTTSSNNSSSSSSSLLDGFVQRGGVGGQPGVDPDKPLGSRGLSFAAQCAVLREVFEDAMAAMPEQPLQAPPRDPILESSLAPRGVSSSAAASTAASFASAAVHAGASSAVPLDSNASSSSTAEEPPVAVPEKAEISLAERTQARRQRRHFRAMKRAQLDAKLDAKARKWLSKGLAALEDMEGLLAAIRCVTSGKQLPETPANREILARAAAATLADNSDPPDLSSDLRNANEDHDTPKSSGVANSKKDTVGTSRSAASSSSTNAHVHHTASSSSLYSSPLLPPVSSTSNGRSGPEGRSPVKITNEQEVARPPLQRREKYNSGTTRSSYSGGNKYYVHDSRARRRAALPLHAQHLTSVRRPLLKRLETAFAALAENTDSVESHVQYAPDGSTELLSFLAGSQSEKTRRTARGEHLDSRHPEIDLVDPPHEVKIDMAMLRRCIVSPCAAHDLRGLVTERTLGVSSIDDADDNNGDDKNVVPHMTKDSTTAKGAAAAAVGRSTAKASLDRGHGQRKSTTNDDDDESARIEVRKRILAGRQKAGLGQEPKGAVESKGQLSGAQVATPKELCKASQKAQPEEGLGSSVDASSLLEGRASRAKAMFGEREVVAACDIPPGAVGPYSGLVLQDKEIVDVLSSPRQLLDVLHFWYSLSDFAGYQFSIFPSLRNPMGLINDFCGPDRRQARKESLPLPNCCYTAVKVNGWPHVFVVALRHIEKGEPLTVDYGDSFWSNFRLLEQMEARFEASWDRCFHVCRNLEQLLAGRVPINGSVGESGAGGLVGSDGCTEQERDLLDAADASDDEAREVAAAKRQARRDEKGRARNGVNKADDDDESDDDDDEDDDDDSEDDGSDEDSTSGSDSEEGFTKRRIALPPSSANALANAAIALPPAAVALIRLPSHTNMSASSQPAAASENGGSSAEDAPASTVAVNTSASGFVQRLRVFLACIEAESDMSTDNGKSSSSRSSDAMSDCSSSGCRSNSNAISSGGCNGGSNVWNSSGDAWRIPKSAGEGHGSINDKVSSALTATFLPSELVHVEVLLKRYGFVSTPLTDADDLLAVTTAAAKNGTKGQVIKARNSAGRANNRGNVRPQRKKPEVAAAKGPLRVAGAEETNISVVVEALSGHWWSHRYLHREFVALDHLLLDNQRVVATSPLLKHSSASSAATGIRSSIDRSDSKSSSSNRVGRGKGNSLVLNQAPSVEEGDARAPCPVGVGPPHPWRPLAGASPHARRVMARLMPDGAWFPGQFLYWRHPENSDTEAKKEKEQVDMVSSSSSFSSAPSSSPSSATSAPEPEPLAVVAFDDGDFADNLPVHMVRFCDFCEYSYHNEDNVAAASGLLQVEEEEKKSAAANDAIEDGTAATVESNEESEGRELQIKRAEEGEKTTAAKHVQEQGKKRKCNEKADDDNDHNNSGEVSAADRNILSVNDTAQPSSESIDASRPLQEKNEDHDGTKDKETSTSGDAITSTLHRRLEWLTNFEKSSASGIAASHLPFGDALPAFRRSPALLGTSSGPPTAEIVATSSAYCNNDNSSSSTDDNDADRNCAVQSNSNSRGGRVKMSGLSGDVGCSSGLRVAVHFPNYGMFAGSVEKVRRALPEWKKKSKKMHKRQRLLDSNGMDGCLIVKSAGADKTSKLIDSNNGSNNNNKINEDNEDIFSKSSESGDGSGAEWVVCFDDGDRKAFSSQEAFAYAVKTYAQVSFADVIAATPTALDYSSMPWVPSSGSLFTRAVWNRAASAVSASASANRPFLSQLKEKPRVTSDAGDSSKCSGNSEAVMAVDTSAGSSQVNSSRNSGNGNGNGTAGEGSSTGKSRNSGWRKRSHFLSMRKKGRAAPASDRALAPTQGRRKATATNARRVPRAAPTTNSLGTAASSVTKRQRRADADLFFYKGQRVSGRYGGGHAWYEGSVLAVNEDGTLAIQYDDGDTESAVLKGLVRPYI